MTFVLQFSEPQTLQRMFENIGHGPESSRTAGGEQQSKWTQSIGEQQLKQMQSGSSSRSGHNQEQQLKRT